MSQQQKELLNFLDTIPECKNNPKLTLKDLSMETLLKIHTFVSQKMNEGLTLEFSSMNKMLIWGQFNDITEQAIKQKSEQTQP